MGRGQNLPLTWGLNNRKQPVKTPSSSPAFQKHTFCHRFFNHHHRFFSFTLPKTNSSPWKYLKIGVFQKETYSIPISSIFRCELASSFREGYNGTQKNTGVSHLRLHRSQTASVSVVVGFKLESQKRIFGQKSQVLNGGVVYLPYGKLLGCPWKWS